MSFRRLVQWWKASYRVRIVAPLQAVNRRVVIERVLDLPRVPRVGQVNVRANADAIEVEQVERDAAGEYVVTLREEAVDWVFTEMDFCALIDRGCTVDGCRELLEWVRFKTEASRAEAKLSGIV